MFGISGVWASPAEPQKTVGRLEKIRSLQILLSSANAGAQGPKMHQIFKRPPVLKFFSQYLQVALAKRHETSKNKIGRAPEFQISTQLLWKPIIQFLWNTIIVS